MTTRKQVWVDGITAGVLGATAVAAWFFVADLIAGSPLYTPDLLGRALFSFFDRGSAHGVLFYTALYTVFHVLAFVVVGATASVLLDVTERMPQAAAGLLLLFAVFEVGFYLMVMALSQPQVIGALAWYQIMAANVVAAGLMGGYLWRRHPEFRPALQHALDGSV